MVFVTAGLGGGTGTGSAPIMASVAKELGILTVAVVTKPFAFEGRKRALQAEAGMAELRAVGRHPDHDPQPAAARFVDRGTPLLEAFKVADTVLLQAVQGISDLILVPGLINLDFADVRTIMSGMGMALMGTGVAPGRAPRARRGAAGDRSPAARRDLDRGRARHPDQLHRRPRPHAPRGRRGGRIVQEAAHEEANIIFGAVHRREPGGRGPNHGDRHRLHRAQGGLTARARSEGRADPVRAARAPSPRRTGGGASPTCGRKARSRRRRIWTCRRSCGGRLTRSVVRGPPSPCPLPPRGEGRGGSESM